MKVLDNEWHHIHYKGKVYRTDETLKIEAKDFDPKVFECLDKAKPVEKSDGGAESSPKEGKPGAK